MVDYVQDLAHLQRVPGIKYVSALRRRGDFGTRSNLVAALARPGTPSLRRANIFNPWDSLHSIRIQER